MYIKIKKGLDLRLSGCIVDRTSLPVDIAADKVAVCPDDFEGFIAKIAVREGDEVVVGQALMYHKEDSRIKLVSPVSGKVVEVRRGERRHIECVVVERSSVSVNRQPAFYDVDTISKLNGSDGIGLLAESGLLAYVRRRPFADIPRTDVMPRDIFVTAFDSAPLACDRVWSSDDWTALQSGADFLSRVTAGQVYVSSREGSGFAKLKNVVNVTVEGPHPAGLPGVQTANIRPVNKGETVWTLSAETMWRIGRLCRTGCFDGAAYVAVTGGCVTQPYVARTLIGASIEPLLRGRLAESDRNVRVISGNVLTGTAIDAVDGYLHFPYTQVTVIPEGNDVDEFMGWASLSPAKMSVNPSFPGRFFRKVFTPDARVLGGTRAMIMSGEYDRVIPMDILAEYLVKAIKARDIENMEKLGIYEVAPEDFALAECVDSSKQPLQRIVREGLDYLRKELK